MSQELSSMSGTLPSDGVKTEPTPLDVPQTPQKVRSRKPKASVDAPVVELTKRRVKRVKDPNAPKRQPTEWQLFIRERSKGRKFTGGRQESRENFKKCSEEYQNMKKKALAK